MKATILSFTGRGAETARAIADLLRSTYDVTLYAPGDARRPMDELFSEMDALIFVGACGIAVRAISPWVRSKETDPAVIVTDERGLNVISLLSGHIGGANALTRRIAEAIGGVPIITTATDINHRFAVDEWAARHGVEMDSMLSAKRFAAEILRHDLPLKSDFPVEGALPSGLYFGDNACSLFISYRSTAPSDTILQLIPRILHLGIGCKRGTSAQRIQDVVFRVLKAQNLRWEAIKAVASIDVKRDEVGLLEFCDIQNRPVEFYSAEELNRVPGEFAKSEFVLGTVGVNNVCERAAMRSAGQGAQSIVKKTCADGVTVAVAQEAWSVCFEMETK